MRSLVLLAAVALAPPLAADPPPWRLLGQTADDSADAIVAVDASGRTTPHATLPEHAGSAVVSPDGRWAAYTSRRKLLLVELATQRVRNLGRSEGRRIGWDATGQLVAATRRDGHKRPQLYRLSPGKDLAKALTSHTTGAWNPTPAPAGAWVAYPRSRVKGNVTYAGLHDLWVTDGTSQRRLTNHAQGATLPRFGPRGAHLAYLERLPSRRDKSPRHGHVQVVEIKTDRRVTVARDRQVIDLAWSPDGRYLAVSEPDHIGIWDVKTRRRAHRIALKTLDPDLAYYGARRLRWRPDGAQLAAVVSYLGQTASVADLDGPRAQPTREARIHSGDGTWLIHTRFAGPKPAVVTAAQRVRLEALIADLGHTEFATREAASRAIAGLGELARPALRAALPSAAAEVKARIRGLLARLDAPRFVPRVTPLRWVRG